MQKVIAYSGVTLAAAFFAWLIIGLLPGVPSMIDVFGVPGLRYPAAVGVGGLLLAAIGFWDF